MSQKSCFFQYFGHETIQVDLYYKSNSIRSRGKSESKIIQSRLLIEDLRYPILIHLHSLQLFHRYQNAFHLFLTYFTISVIFWSCLYLDLFQRILNCKYEWWLEIFLSIAQNLHFNAKLSTFFAIKCCYLVSFN